MSKTIYQQSIEPLTLDERLRRLERQVSELTAQVAWLLTQVRATAPVPPPHPTDAGRC